MNKPRPSTRAKAFARAEITGMACDDYKALASALYNALMYSGLADWDSGITEADIQGMPDGDSCPLAFLAWWNGEEA